MLLLIYRESQLAGVLEFVLISLQFMEIYGFLLCQAVSPVPRMGQLYLHCNKKNVKHAHVQ